MEVLAFRLVVPREKVELPVFFCRVNEEKLITEFKEKLNKGDIVFLEGFLQTQEVEKEVKGEVKRGRVSSINCYGFTLLENDSVNAFYPLDNLTRVGSVKEVRKIFKPDETEE